jgi:hypothetical protein
VKVLPEPAEQVHQIMEHQPVVPQVQAELIKQVLPNLVQAEAVRVLIKERQEVHLRLPDIHNRLQREVQAVRIMTEVRALAVQVRAEVTAADQAAAVRLPEATAAVHHHPDAAAVAEEVAAVVVHPAAEEDNSDRYNEL